ncbi:hypothetical protein EJ05DRAFT_238646 [Pseudovirgaria hyperparasitica]|uniref:Uncharacterized protein n=1 Tax=Pseudovirgaria hyperparasitica TaxID=470096 RepID=A0A6A6VRN0_9PEZI|nr:uncharacterized protein EJ05DRAFT_238646 [Pseudovirgaria hyperparasitica]KAF2752815.1 hypothetical protein EJ05DRAFT_238646 [Pseudovirgaria hyperparasitica]
MVQNEESFRVRHQCLLAPLGIVGLWPTISIRRWRLYNGVWPDYGVKLIYFHGCTVDCDVYQFTVYMNMFAAKLCQGPPAVSAVLLQGGPYLADSGGVNSRTGIRNEW